MIYTMPRMTTRLNLQADRPGVYDGCRRISAATAFPGMQFKAHVLPPQQFAAWAQAAHGQGGALDGRTYAELSKPSSYVKPMTYGTVAPGLFDAIVANKAPRPQHAAAQSASRDTEQGAERMLRQAHLGRHPASRSDPADHIARRDPGGGGVGHLGLAQGLVALSVERVHHVHRSQEHRHHVHRACAADAGPRLCRRDHDAASPVHGDRRVHRAICRPSITTRSSPRTARS